MKEEEDGIITSSVMRRGMAMVALSTAMLGNLPERIDPVSVSKKAGRNDPCPCNSGKKYKKCCI